MITEKHEIKLECHSDSIWAASGENGAFESFGLTPEDAVAEYFWAIWKKT